MINSLLLNNNIIKKENKFIKKNINKAIYLIKLLYQEVQYYGH